MARKRWDQLASNELVCHEEIMWAAEDEVFSLFEFIDGQPPIDPPLGECYTKAMFEVMVKHNASNLAALGLASNEYMSKADIAACAIYQPPADPAVSGFGGAMRQGTCGETYRIIDLSWANPSTGNDTKTLEYSINGSTWHTLSSSLSASATGYAHTYNDPGTGFPDSMRYRIKVSGYSTWMTTQVSMICIE